MIQETLSILTRQTILQRIGTKIAFPPEKVIVQGEDTLLQLVFMNILLNALQAMQGGGELSINILTSASIVSVHITDTGCGIPERDIERVFDPFYTTSPVGKGTGLGLSICYSIVKQHGGSISVRSAEGVGSTFSVTLPLYSPHSESGVTR
jgi:signal transduction histidine kinase